MPPVLDAIDRKLLGLLSRDASQSYASLGAAVHLSTAAVHERVRKLRRAGVILRTTVALDGEKLGRALLAFVHVETIGWGKSQELLALEDDPRLEEMHSVTGNACILMKVRCSSTQDLEDLLERIYQMPGVRGTRTDVVLRSVFERGPGVLPV